MTRLSRRLFLSGAATFAVSGTGLAATRPLFGSTISILNSTRGTPNPVDSIPLDPATRASRIAWLKTNAAPMSSLDIADDDFADLEDFGKAVGDARIVMLGEITHGDGAAFLAKSRLVRFLHERMGFDVLAFESGIYDMCKVWERMRGGEDPRAAARRGIFGIWSASQQVQPLIDYVGTRARSSRPLELAGFDSQFSGSAARDFLVKDLIVFLAARGIDTASILEWTRFCAVFEEKLLDIKSIEQKFSAEELRLMLSTLDTLIARIATMEDDEAGFWRQVFKGHKVTAQDLFDYVPGKLSLLDYNPRDAAMGENLIWLAREAYPQRKIIVWAATFHNMRNPHLIDGEPYSQPFNELKTMGHFAWQALGSEIFNVGFITSEGEHGWINQTPTPVIPPDPDSLEDLWAHAGHKHAFLDMRHVAAGGEWLQAPFVSHAVEYALPMMAPWCQVLDAMVFIRTMQPSVVVKSPALPQSVLFPIVGRVPR